MGGQAVNVAGKPTLSNGDDHVTRIDDGHPATDALHAKAKAVPPIVRNRIETLAAHALIWNENGTRSKATGSRAGNRPRR